jgi:predicted MFS family arabinose efflux permease
MLGDATAPGARQVAFARFSSGSVVGQLVGLTAAGALGEALGWLHGFLFVWVGVGFFISLQNKVMELAPAARGSATALHYFSFFMGKAAGPLVFGMCLASFGPTTSFLVNAILIAAAGVLSAHALYRAECETGPSEP